MSTKSLLKSGLAILLAAQLSACSSDSDELTAAEQDNQDLFEYLQTDYFWNEDLPASINVSAYADMPEAMYRLRVPEDRFSFVMTNDEYADYVASVFFGYGFGHTNTADEKGLLIRYVYDEGSAAQNGLRRGDVITKVNDILISDYIAGYATSEEVFGPNEDGYTVDVTFEKPDGTVVETSFSKGEIIANTVMATEVLDANVGGETKKVGYLVFDSFKETSEQELNTAFATFADNQVEELVVDLRYNGGGRVSIAKQLSTQIAGDAVENEIFVQYVFNNLRSGDNSTSYFGSESHELNLDRVVVLTTSGSCSASEMTINSLAPFIDVVVVGDQTCGKPVGMYPTEINDYTVFAINFQAQNAVGFGDYFDGLSVDCAADDLPVGDWGDTQDPLLAEALHYLENGQCSAESRAYSKSLRYASKAKVDFSQGPVKAKSAL